MQHELADIFIYLAYVAEKFDIDLEQAIIEKIEINGQKHPLAKDYFLLATEPF